MVVNSYSPKQLFTTTTNICCIGAGYVGGPTSSVIACKNPGIAVHVVDRNEDRIRAWLSDDLPITEPDLLEVVKTARDGTDGRPPNLRFSTNVEQAIADADLIFIAVNTPTKSSGYGAHQALDIAHVESAVETIARVASTDKIVVEKSTVPCGTSRSINEILTGLGQPGVRIDVLSNPEFLAEGTAVRNLLRPDRVLIGSESTERGLRARDALSAIYRSWVPAERVVLMNLQSAELAKLAANALLAQRISSINALSAICEETGADIEEVAMACGLDTRIGPGMLRASVGFGGSCFKKDVLTLAHFSDTLGLSMIGSYWRSVNSINEFQKSRFAERIVRRMNNTLIGKKVAVLGCAFKKNTGDIRESAAISLLAGLIAEQAHVAVYDPLVKPQELLEALERAIGAGMSQFLTKLDICPSAYDTCDQAHAVVIATEWDEFSNRDGSKASSHLQNPATVRYMRASPSSSGVCEEADACSESTGSEGMLTPATYASSSEDTTTSRLDWSRIADSLKHPKLVFDGRNIVDHRRLASLGLRVEAVGKTGLRRTADR
jgi:UDPglucose 6-dehydrogenase